ncbi:MAG: hypothetical protein ACR2LR_13065 [Hassallia sp.]
MPISSSKNIKIADVVDLAVALDAKSPISHTHAIAIIEGLQAALDAKSATSHTHTPDVWQDISLSTSWTNYASGYSTPQVRKYPSGIIEVKGVIKKSSALVASEIMCTLPTGYRPTEIMLLTTWASGGTSRIQVETAGAIRLNSGNTSGVGLNFFFS